MILTPYLMNDYKLIFLFIPIWLFVNAKEYSKFDVIYCALFGLLLIPKALILLNHPLGIEHEFSNSIIINPVLIMLFMGLIIFEQFYKKQKEE